MFNGRCLGFIVAAATAGCAASSVLGAVRFEATYNTDRNLSQGAPAAPLGHSGTTVAGGKLSLDSTTAYVDYGPASNYFGYTSGTSWGSNTIVMIVNSSVVNENRHWFASTGGSWDGTIAANGNAGSNGIQFLDAGNGVVELSVSGYYNAATVDTNGLVQGNAGYALAPNTDYFIAASWRDDAVADGVSNLDLRMYVRKLGDVAGTDFVAYVSSSGVTTSADTQGNSGYRLENQKWTVAARPEHTAESLLGTIDYHRISDTFTDSQPQFAALFDEVTGVPEPSMLGLMGLVAAAAVRRQRRGR